jgi:hypothetical protein
VCLTADCTILEYTPISLGWYAVTLGARVYRYGPVTKSKTFLHSLRRRPGRPPFRNGIVKVSCVPCVSRLPPVLKFKFKLLHKQQTTVLFVAMTL